MMPEFPKYPAILRFALAIVDVQYAAVPASHRVLSVAPGRGRLSSAGVGTIDLWVECSPSNAKRELPVYIVGTGNPLPLETYDAEFVGSCVMDNELVWHVYVGKPGSVYA